MRTLAERGLVERLTWRTPWVDEEASERGITLAEVEQERQEYSTAMWASLNSGKPIPDRKYELVCDWRPVRGNAGKDHQQRNTGRLKITDAGRALVNTSQVTHVNGSEDDS